MQIFAGTSGFSYAEWCGRFYPEALPGAQMLRFYAGRLPTVEINNTFYRLPTREMVAAWGDQVPASFCFAVKATRRITHQKRLADVGADLGQLFDVIDVLENKLGPVLFQLPPFLKKDLGLLAGFLQTLPRGRRVALEFRHDSWFAEDVYQSLAAHNVALVGGDLEEAAKSPPLVATADFGYLRLRKLDYNPAELVEWGARIRAQNWSHAYAYLKHEVLGPLFAEALLANSYGRAMADLSSIRASIAAPPSKPKSKRASKLASEQVGASKSDQAPPKRANTAPEPGKAGTPKSKAGRSSKPPRKSSKS